MTTMKEELADIDAQIAKLESRREEIFKISLTAPDAEKVAEDWIAASLSDPMPYLRYPITISGIAFGEAEIISHKRRENGAFVAVRPCDKELKNKTFLGIYIGEVALSQSVSFHRETGVLNISPGMYNPAIWVPDLKRVVFGCGSWWGVLKTPDDLKQITDADIDNIWYVKAMRSVGAKPAPVDA